MSVARGVLAAAAAAAVLVFGAPPLGAQEFSRDVRLKVAGYFPVELPTTEGTLWGLEVRTYSTPTRGFAYGIHHFDEQRTEFIVLNLGGTPTTFTFKAEVKMQPILISWFRYWALDRATLFAGGGPGVYFVDAFSGGFSRQAGLQIREFGEFRFLEDATLIGVHFYGGVDLFPDARWGASIEGRFHFVEDDYSASELALSGIFRF